MQKKGANISLKGYDDIFSTDQSRAEAQQERVQEIPLSDLHPFEGHPFRVVDDEEMLKTAESVREFGVPALSTALLFRSVQKTSALRHSSSLF